MEKLKPADLHFVVSRIPKDVVDLMKTYNLILAGGFVRSVISGEKISDLDLFGKDLQTSENAAYKLSAERKARIVKTDNAITLLSPPRYPVQFIKRWTFKSPEDCVKSFDFTVCQAGVFYDDGKWDSCIHPYFYSDLAGKRLVYTLPIREEAAGGSLLRVRKFLSRGYNIQSGSLAKVLARIFVKIE